MAKANNKNTFILRTDFYPQVKLLTREQRGDLLLAIFSHAVGMDAPTMDGMTQMCFEFMRQTMDSYSTQYNLRCEQNRRNRTGGKDARFYERQSAECEAEEKITIVNDRRRPSTDINESRQSSSIVDEIAPFPPVPPYPPREGEFDCEDEKTHTLTVRDLKGECEGENSLVGVEADKGVIRTLPDMAAGPVGLVRWVEVNLPTIAGMDEPLTEQHAVWMLRKYAVSDICRILTEMHNKRAYRNVNAYSTFNVFARYDKKLADQKPARVVERQYSWDEVAEWQANNRRPWPEYFERHEAGGRKWWTKKRQSV